MKLIDVLVMISKGELKEGAKIKVSIMDDEYTYNWCYELVDRNGKRLFDNYNLYALHQEVELIEPKCFSNMGNTLEPTDNTAEKIKELDNYDWEEGDYDYQIEIIYRKLNEVIRRINNVR